jgi:hypothetical protein
MPEGTLKQQVAERINLHTQFFTGSSVTGEPYYGNYNVQYEKTSLNQISANLLKRALLQLSNPTHEVTANLRTDNTVQPPALIVWGHFRPRIPE